MKHSMTFRTAALLTVLSVSAPALAEVLILRGGGRIEGRIVKRTEESLFVDVGYTILQVPAKEVGEVRQEPEAKAPPADASALEAPPAAAHAAVPDALIPPKLTAPAPGPVPGEIYSTGSLDAGSVKDKAREVGSGVVQVICPGKRGSGFIINEAEGFVVTNCHVVEDDQNISVEIYVKEAQDFRKVRLDRVRIVAMNPFLDIALLRIEPEQEGPDGRKSERPALQKVFLGDSETVRVGDPVFAIGSPMGLERTVTEGIVSNNRRALGGLAYIQMSAPINPGNSGGPLFNDHGEVVGITSLKVTFGEALGFAIPVAYLKDFLRNRESFSFDKDNANNGIRYLDPPRKRAAAPRKL